MDKETVNENFDACEIKILRDNSRNKKIRVKGKKKYNQRYVDIKSFKASILRTKKLLLSKMQLEKYTLDELDELMFHLLEIFDKELHELKRKEFRFGKTVSPRDLETVVKLCLPKGLAAPVTEFANTAVETYFNQVLKEG